MTDILHALMLNRNIINERILITLRNWSLKSSVKSLMTFLIFWDYNMLLNDISDLQI